MPTLQDDDAWRMAMAAAAVLRGRVWPVEARDDSGAIAGFRGSMATRYEWINVQVYDPTSHAFGALPTATSAPVDYALYGQETRRALALWTAIARCPGYSARENSVFWLRVLREVAPSGHGHVSDVPRFFDSPRAVFPRFRLTFQPRDCYDEDSHDDDDAIDWINAFWKGFFGSKHDEASTSEVGQHIDQLSSYVELHTRVPLVPLQVVFRVPMKRTHGPLGSALEQHRGFLRNASALSTQCGTQDVSSDRDGFRVQFIGSLVALRGSIRPCEYCEIAPHLQASDKLQVSGLCVDIGDEQSLTDLSGALVTTGVTAVTMNVSKTTAASIASLAALLEACPRLTTLRLFNAFATTDTRERQAQWQHLGRALSRSHVEELVLERSYLGEEDAEAFRSAYIDNGPTNQLLSLTIKPLTTAALATEAYASVVRAIGGSLEHLDVSALCLSTPSIDSVLVVCPRIRAVSAGVVDDIDISVIIEKLRARECPLSALSVSCSAEGARRITSALANQSPETALVGLHLKELRLSVDVMEPATREALVHMLETNESLRYVHVKSRAGPDAAALAEDEQLLAHHQRQLVRKLPMAHTLAFLSVLAHDTVASATPLARFDAGIASEIVGFAGHAIHRQLHCS